MSSYPVLNDLELNDGILAIEDNIEDEKDVIDEYFFQLTKMIEVIIKRRKHAFKEKANLLGSAYKRSIDCRADIMQLEKLKRILLENDNGELATFIKSHVSNVDSNTSKLQSIYNEY